ncbi:putative repeat protein (TIGR01451 family) [Arcanobacterium pluranimalium]|uniref:beta strand repeat-containing protein n=1 Tax=Arcanobacterium pluranimalium TaxID=108028 RepID=UPI00195A82D0|nr:hypothetical protein [Arcanobacterium pluranimalium]MBM7824988.1 putative repeat protein (TIGR01451 family) [Arcanobacterium pluranimalium]
MKEIFMYAHPSLSGTPKKASFVHFLSGKYGFRKANGRKYGILALCFAMIIGAFSGVALPAFAAGGQMTVTVTPQQSTFKPGEKVKYIVSYTCSVASCDNAQISFQVAGQKGETLSELITSANVNASYVNTSAMYWNAGNLAAGTTGSFMVELATTNGGYGNSEALTLSATMSATGSSNATTSAAVTAQATDQAKINLAYSPANLAVGNTGKYAFNMVVGSNVGALYLYDSQFVVDIPAGAVLPFLENTANGTPVWTPGADGTGGTLTCPVPARPGLSGMYGYNPGNFAWCTADITFPKDRFTPGQTVQIPGRWVGNIEDWTSGSQVRTQVTKTATFSTTLSGTVPNQTSQDTNVHASSGTKCMQPEQGYTGSVGFDTYGADVTKAVFKFAQPAGGTWVLTNVVPQFKTTLDLVIEYRYVGDTVTRTKHIAPNTDSGAWPDSGGVLDWVQVTATGLIVGGGITSPLDDLQIQYGGKFPLGMTPGASTTLQRSVELTYGDGTVLTTTIPNNETISLCESWRGSLTIVAGQSYNESMVGVPFSHSLTVSQASYTASLAPHVSFIVPSNLAFDPKSVSFVSGTAGIPNVAPLSITSKAVSGGTQWDIDWSNIVMPPLVDTKTPINFKFSYNVIPTAPVTPSNLPYQALLWQNANVPLQAQPSPGMYVNDTYNVDSNDATTVLPWGSGVLTYIPLTQMTTNLLTNPAGLALRDAQIEPGGTYAQDLLMSNTTAVDYKDAVVYAVLPYVGDHGLLGTNESTVHGSQWAPVFAGVSSVPAGYTVEYSTSTNPCRTEVNTAAAGCVNDWTSTAPADLSTVKALRFKAGATVLPAGKSVSFQWKLTAPANATGTAYASVARSSVPVGSSAYEITETALTSATVMPSAIDVTSSFVLNDKNGDGKGDAGETVTWNYVVKNTGGATLNNIVINGRAVTCTPTTLAGGAQATCSTTSTISQADVDAQSYLDVVTASGTNSVGQTVTSVQRTLSVPLASGVGVKLDKQAKLSTDANANGLADVNDVITYTFVVTNTGDQTVNNLTLDDKMLTDLGLTLTCPASVGPGVSVNCASVDMMVSASQVDTLATITNSASVSGKTGLNADVTSNVSTTNTATNQAAGIAANDASLVLVNDADGDGVIDLGDTVKAVITVVNTGGVTLSTVGVASTNTSLPMTCVKTSLGAGETTTCESSVYAASQADIDSGKITTTLNPTGVSPASTKLSAGDFPVSLATSQVSGLVLVKTAKLTGDVNSNGAGDPGDTVTYTFTVTNTGDVTISSPVIADQNLADRGITVTCPATIGAKTSVACGPVDMKLTQADVDAGATFVNTASVSGKNPDGTAVTSGFHQATTGLNQIAQIAGVTAVKLVDDADGDGLADAGDTVQLTMTVTNTGAVSVDTLTATVGSGYTMTCTPSKIGAGQTATCTSQPVSVTQADVDAGTVQGSVETTGVGVNKINVTTGKQTASLPTDSRAELSLSGQVWLNDVNDNQLADEDETVTFVYTVTNTGTRSVDSLTGVLNPTVDGAGLVAGDTDRVIDCDKAALAPGQSAVCKETVTVTKTDITAGKVRSALLAKAIASGNVAVQTTPVILEQETTKPVAVPQAPEQASTPVLDLVESVLAKTGSASMVLVFVALMLLGAGVGLRRKRA